VICIDCVFSFQLPRNVTIGGHMVTTSKAYLNLQLPFEDNSKDFSPSRFEDKEVSSKPLALGH